MLQQKILKSTINLKGKYVDFFVLGQTNSSSNLNLKDIALYQYKN